LEWHGITFKAPSEFVGGRRDSNITVLYFMHTAVMLLPYYIFIYPQPARAEVPAMLSGRLKACNVSITEFPMF